MDDLRPIRPINPWGRKPEVDTDWKNPFNAELYRVFVWDEKTKQPLAVTPGMVKQVAEQFLDTVTNVIRDGRIRGWSDPTLVKVFARELA